MRKRVLLLPLILYSQLILAQGKAFEAFLADSTMKYAAASICIADPEKGDTIFDYNSTNSLIPASILKLLTTSAALELLGPGYTFKTKLGYSGSLEKRRGILNGNIIIKGGGDPSLGSGAFGDHYTDFDQKWINEILKTGIRKIKGKVITDDSYYDFEPVPGKWLWEDAGQYYGAGAYGLSLYDNTFEIHFSTSSDSTNHMITGIVPEGYGVILTDRLGVQGTEDEGYVFAAPYSKEGWISGTIPADQDDFILKASIPDPPLLIARITDGELRNAGIRISGKPSTYRVEPEQSGEFTEISRITSPSLADIIKVLNHESVNLYAEHLVKELGRTFKHEGSTKAGTEVVYEFMRGTGISTDGIFMEDGSGLSPLNCINAKAMVDLLIYMKRNSICWSDFFGSLPEAGKEGTLKNYFTDPIFESRLSAKSGSMTRVRSYAGYLRTMSNKELVFCIIVNNFTGPSRNIVTHIEQILKETILNE